MFTYYLYAKLLNYKYLQEKSEFPFVLNKRSFWGKLYARFYVSNFYRLFDGMIVMTDALQNYFKNKINRNATIFKLPMTVEMNRFEYSKKIYPFEYIAYCGFMGGNKDGVDILIRAFGEISNEFNEKKLVLIGDGPSEDMNKYRSIVHNMGIDQKVIFTGNVSRNEIPDYLCNAKILALARPSSLQSSGGFPSKLGEYLSTGKPVVVTSTGEITNYLINESTAFIAEPGNINSFAECLRKVLNNQELAERVGKEGKLVAAGCFDYQLQSLNLQIIY